MKKNGKYSHLKSFKSFIQSSKIRYRGCFKWDKISEISLDILETNHRQTCDLLSVSMCLKVLIFLEILPQLIICQNILIISKMQVFAKYPKCKFQKLGLLAKWSAETKCQGLFCQIRFHQTRKYYLK